MQNDVNILKATVYPEVCLLNHMVVLLVIFLGSHHTVFPVVGACMAAWAPHERLTDLAVVPREKAHTGAAAREQPQDSPGIAR